MTTWRLYALVLAAAVWLALLGVVVARAEECEHRRIPSADGVLEFSVPCGDAETAWVREDAKRVEKLARAMCEAVDCVPETLYYHEPCEEHAGLKVCAQIGWKRYEWAARLWIFEQSRGALP